MKNFLLTLFAFFALAQATTVSAQTQYEVEGVIVPRTIDFEGNKLSLNGFGIRSKMWIDVYVQALYVTTLSEDAKEILESDTEMAVRLQIISSMVTSKKLSKSLNKGMRKSVGEENIEKYRVPLDILEGLLNKEDTKDKDFFNLIYNPDDQSIWVYKNDRLEGKIPGFEFKKAFFGIWLSDNPVDADLKKALLGKS
jgi:Chalcone isomerase-like